MRRLKLIPADAEWRVKDLPGYAAHHIQSWTEGSRWLSRFEFLFSLDSCFDFTTIVVFCFNSYRIFELQFLLGFSYWFKLHLLFQPFLYLCSLRLALVRLPSLAFIMTGQGRHRANGPGRKQTPTRASTITLWLVGSPAEPSELHWIHCFL